MQFRFKDLFKDRRKKNSQLAPVMLGSGVSLPTLTQSQVVQKFKTSPFLYLCINTIVNGVAQNNFKLYQRQRNGSKKLLFQHDLIELLKNPNPLMNGVDFIKTIQGTLDLSGESFILVERGDNGKPLYLWALSNKEILQKPSAQDKYTYKVQINGMRYSVPASEIIYFKNVDYTNIYGQGVSTTGSIAQDIQIEENISLFLNSFFYNSCLPAGLIGIDGTDRDELEALKLQYEVDNKGMFNNFRTHFFNTADFKFVSTQQNLSELGITELRNQEFDIIRQAFQIPKELIGNMENANRASSLVASELFLSQAILPRLQKLTQVLNNTLVKMFDESLFLEISVETEAQKEQKLKVMQSFPAAFTYDEIREMAGLEPIIQFSGKLYDGEVENRGDKYAYDKSYTNQSDKDSKQDV